ncbi:hypothetical protein KI387_003098, partial [Taxus chinensis]
NSWAEFVFSNVLLGSHLVRWGSRPPQEVLTIQAYGKSVIERTNMLVRNMSLNGVLRT